MKKRREKIRKGEKVSNNILIPYQLLKDLIAYFYEADEDPKAHEARRQIIIEAITAKWNQLQANKQAHADYIKKKGTYRK